MSKPLSIVIVGTGNVAYHIASSMRELQEVKLIQVFNHQNSKNAKLFSKNFHSSLVTNYSAIDKTADIYIIAVKDAAIVEVAKNLKPLHLKGIIVHTSGSIDLSALKNASQNSGVYYPLQTFYKGAKIDWQQTPILIEANSKATESKLKRLASLVSRKVKVVDSNNRLQIHLAAVFACNFTNAMYVSAYQLIENNLSKKDTELLLPIMQHSFQKLQSVHPKNAQTGPAMRNDKLVMKKHLDLIKNNKQLTQVYKTLSDLILAQQNLK